MHPLFTAIGALFGFTILSTISKANQPIIIRGAVVTDNQTQTNNLDAFLLALRLGEGTSDEKGYYRKVGGGEVASLEKHPGYDGFKWYFTNPATGKRDYSTAAGAYQINLPTYKEFAPRLGIDTFYASDQDIIAIAIIKSEDAYVDVLNGDIASAVEKVSNRWASLPGSQAKQRTVSFEQFSQVYANSGGTFA
jgi:muramidase (phage lysozyme)